MTPDRYALMDFAEGYAYSTVVILIPMPESSDNGAAIVLPFQFSVKHFLINKINKSGN
jgi:hypothetical protein